jgi:hypothetical protein
VTEAEVKQTFIHDKEQVNVEYIRVDPAQFVPQVEMSDADLSTLPGASGTLSAT